MGYVNNINKILDILNINQSELAKRLGLSRAVISEFTNGSREPSKEFILSLNKKLGISVDWFITGEGEMFLPGKDPRKPQEAKSDTVSLLEAAPPDAGKNATVADLAKAQAAGSGKFDTVSLLDTAAPEAPRQAAVPLPAGPEPPKRIRRISLELQGLADELDVGGPVPARLRPLVRRVARLDDEDLAKTTAYVDDLLQKVKYAQGDELADSDAIQGGAEAGIA